MKILCEDEALQSVLRLCDICRIKLRAYKKL